ncbi:MerR family transcriptional regulator [bacterium]|nr:MerR family transcriptional regulator [bacterium]
MTKTKKINDLAEIIPTGTLAQVVGVHSRTLRIWDKKGLLCPGRSTKNRRNYTMKDVERAKVIYFMTRNLALNLCGVKILLAILEKEKVASSDMMKYVLELTKLAKISKQEQEINIKKTEKRHSA